ncbi:thiamine ABC transporter substrate-binding protein [Saccharothrix violaceirubra]|uniref:Thiamine transport system substrate-binding protein n=1 Tax=Saccharothrix violaceirubra TaxID=413306 RepID=A0A7W7WYE5_9PSEU|nr:thiamine ABC transporter substrate-binding protein [Saccharothrix violaceirubra]MBB4968449.1 thiamine transport system substrate-binding protein [Saccharothrix violaceirubra]
MLRRVLAAASVLALAACSATEPTPSQGERVVTLVTHDSFVVKPELLDAFKAETGITVKQVASGDAGELTNKLVLTKDSPIGDVAFGVDSTFASRALKEGVFAEYDSGAAKNGAQRYALTPANRLHAVDVGDVCLNYDIAALKDKGEPQKFADLLDPKYKDLLVVEDPATSSPGLAFLLSTIATYGDGGDSDWRTYWAGLKANGVKVVSGWEEAYTQDFSGSAGKGPRPIVVSYASSPSAEIGADGNPRTRAVFDTCYRQVEYAGVLSGAKNTEDARKVVDFLLSEKFQSTVAENMYVYPSREGVSLPESWAKAAPLPPSSRTVPADLLDAKREEWVKQWRSLVVG